MRAVEHAQVCWHYHALPPRVSRLTSLSIGVLEPAGEGTTERASLNKVFTHSFSLAARHLSLHRVDDEIFEHLGTAFPELMVEPYDKIAKIDEEAMKSKDGKKRWREFIETYKDKVKDYNFGSLIRTDSKSEYSEDNTIFGMHSHVYHYVTDLTSNLPSLVTRLQVRRDLSLLGSKSNPP